MRDQHGDDDAPSSSPPGYWTDGPAGRRWQRFGNEGGLAARPRDDGSGLPRDPRRDPPPDDDIRRRSGDPGSPYDDEGGLGREWASRARLLTERAFEGPAASDPGTARPSRRGRGPRGYRPSDARLQERICEALTEHPVIDPSDLSVSVANGAVTLSGSVASRAVKYQVETLAEDCGAREVHDRMTVARGPAPDPAADAPDSGFGRR